jgi:hypothetical protein
MSMPVDPFFSEGTPETPPIGTCALPTCGKEFKPLYPGQKFCCNECGVLALPKRKVMQPEPEPTVQPVQTEEMQQATLPLYSEHDEFADA